MAWTGKEFLAMEYNYSYAPETFETLDYSLYRSVDGTQWEYWGTITKTNLEHIFYMNNIYYVIGKQGMMLWSSDGKEWMEIETGTTNQLNGLAWNGEQFVCVGDNGLILSSPNGIEWTNRKTGTVSNLNDIVWNGKTFITVGNNKTILKSKDGFIWKKYFDEVDNYDLIDMLWDGERFILLHRQGEVLSTKDGNQLITESTSPNYYQPLSMAWNGEVYIIVGRGGSIAVCMPTDIIKVKINGVPIPFDVAPRLINGRTMIPARTVMEKLGADIKWEAKNQTVKIIKDSIKISLTIGEPNAIVNGEKVQLDSPAIVIDGRTLIPVRFVAESLGASVSWNSDARTALINN